jgi:hypothetical protein
VVIVGGVGLGLGLFLANLTKGNGGPLPSTTTLMPESAAPFWKPIMESGQPPADVVGNIQVPVGAVSTGYDNLDGGITQYDRRASFFVPASTSDILGFYALQLPATGWKVRATATIRGHAGRQLLAYRFSKDSYEWQLKIAAEPATRAGTAGTSLTVEAFQVSEDES